MTYTPPQYKIKFDVDNIAKVLYITPEEVVKEFKDGRVISRFSESWAGQIYNFKKEENTNTEGYDGTITNPLFGVLHVGVRSLTKSGIRFQKSKFIGGGRKCTTENLIESIKDIDFEIVVDINDFPCIVFSPVSKDKLLNLINNGELTVNGFNRDQFYKKIFGNTINNLDLEYYDLNKTNSEQVDTQFRHNRNVNESDENLNKDSRIIITKDKKISRKPRNKKISKKHRNKKRSRKPRINLNTILNVGDIITFIRDENITAIILENNKIEYNGEITSLSKSAQELTGMKAAQGPIFWMYGGETLDERRKRILGNK